MNGNSLLPAFLLGSNQQVNLFLSFVVYNSCLFVCLQLEKLVWLKKLWIVLNCPIEIINQWKKQTKNTVFWEAIFYIKDHSCDKKKKKKVHLKKTPDYSYVHIKYFNFTYVVLLCELLVLLNTSQNATKELSKTRLLLFMEASSIELC